MSWSRHAKCRLRTAPCRYIQTFDNLPADVTITRTGKPILARGTGGRASRTGYTATVFGATGFLGTYLTTKLASQGTITLVPFREEMKKRHLKVQGDLGVVNFVEFDLRNLQSIDDAVQNSDIVFNLIGRDYPTKNFTFDDVHVEGTRRILDAVVRNNVARFVHVSSHSADVQSTSEFYRSKAKAEALVRSAVPHATIVRPGPMFGPQDRFLNKLASASVNFSCNDNKQTLYPTYVLDVAFALERIGYDDTTMGKTYELNGPEQMSMQELLELVEDATLKKVRRVHVSAAVQKSVAAALQYVYWRTVCPDEIERSLIDQVTTPDALTFSHLGIMPTSVRGLVLALLRHHRSYLTIHNSLEDDAKRKRDVASLDAMDS